MPYLVYSVRKLIGQDYDEIEITAAAAEGNCIAKIEGQVVFIPFAAPGDVADIRITRKQKKVLFGTVRDIRKASPDRVIPACEHFGVCGGCKWQHVDYAAQLRYKQQQVTDNLERIGKIALPPTAPIAGSEKIYAYRNRLDYGFSHMRYFLDAEKHEENKGDMRAAGFHVPGRFDKILDLKKCHLQDNLSNEIRDAVKAKAIELQMPFYDLRNHEGLMRSLIVRNTTMGDWMVIIAFRAADDRNMKLLQFVKEKFPQITSLLYVINHKNNDTIYDLEIKTFSGKDHVIEKLGNLLFKVGPKSFFQTNTHQAETLYAIARDFAGLTGTEHVYDLYTGTGSIALYIADKARKVTGVEYVQQAIDDAWENARLNQIEHVQFYAGDMKDLLTREFVEKEGRPDVIITDPPRAGMHPDVVKMLLEINAPKIVYVSCNPATQARDLQLLDVSYRVEKVQPVDMFPHTHHVENVVLLTRRT